MTLNEALKDIDFSNKSMLETAKIILENLEFIKEKEFKEEPVKKTRKKKIVRSGVPDGLFFYDLFNKVAELKNFSEQQKDDNISQFYTNLTLSGDFILTGENYWDLTNRHYLSERNIDMNDIYDDGYDEEKIIAAKQKYIEHQTLAGKEIDAAELDSLLSDIDKIDELLNEETPDVIVGTSIDSKNEDIYD